MDCDQALLFISMKIDGELTEQESLQLDAHLADCPACRALLADFEAMHAAMPAPVEVPADLKDKIMEQVRQSKVVPMAAPKKRARWKPWASVAAVLVLVLLGAGALRILPLGGLMGASGGAAEAPEAQSVADTSAPMPAEFAYTESSNSTEERKTEYAAGTESPMDIDVPSSSPVSDISIQEDGTALARTYLGKAQLAGPWCGILVIPARYLPDWSQRTALTVLDDIPCYSVPAEEFRSLTEQASVWDGAEALSVGDGISPDAAQGLVILTGFTAE